MKGHAENHRPFPPLIKAKRFNTFYLKANVGINKVPAYTP